MYRFFNNPIQVDHFTPTQQGCTLGYKINMQDGLNMQVGKIHQIWEILQTKNCLNKILRYMLNFLYFLIKTIKRAARLFDTLE